MGRESPERRAGESRSVPVLGAGGPMGALSGVIGGSGSSWVEAPRPRGLGHQLTPTLPSSLDPAPPHSERPVPSYCLQEQ